jgi:hypothetical protein
MTAKLREVDTRTILGNGGNVALYMPAAKTSAKTSSENIVYSIVITDCQGEPVHTILAESRADALEAFRHPFARQDTPDVFARVPEDWQPEDEAAAEPGETMAPDEAVA